MGNLRPGKRWLGPIRGRLSGRVDAFVSGALSPRALILMVEAIFYHSHSDQLVTLTTVEPPRPVRIVGITHDYGLLRTLPERTGWSNSYGHGAEGDYIDLQPDGNSFDIMTGLIKAKK